MPETEWLLFQSAADQVACLWQPQHSANGQELSLEALAQRLKRIYAHRESGDANWAVAAVHAMKRLSSLCPEAGTKKQGPRGPCSQQDRQSHCSLLFSLQLEIQ